MNENISSHRLKKCTNATNEKKNFQAHQELHIKKKEQQYDSN